MTSCSIERVRGRPLKLLNVVDEFTRECLAIEVARKQSSKDILRSLAGLMLKHGVPKHTRSDNGPEFVAKAVRDSIYPTGQSLGERLRRELQRKTQVQTPQRGNLHNAARGKSVD
jgi:transposase InsO family protein